MLSKYFEFWQAEFNILETKVQCVTVGGLFDA